MQFFGVQFLSLRTYAFFLFVGIGAITSAIAQVNPSNNLTFNVATYNLRLNIAVDGANAWTYRKDAVRDLIRYHEFDVFGTQEGLSDQIADLALMSEYKHVGVGRDDGKQAGEFSAIFYRRDRFTLEGNGDFWLSQTPDKPSLGWDAVCCKRIASWAKLHDVRSGKLFFVFSVHFDHEGIVARRESAKLMLKKIAEIAGTNPVLCVGDFNSTPETEQILVMKSLLLDAYQTTLAPPYGPIGTFNDFKLNASMTERIDYIFTNREIAVLKYGVLSDSFNQRFPSDHHPVVARVEIR